MEPEKRRTPRYIFFAAAELMEEKSEVRIASRLSELSLHGCYLDMMNPFPVGTSILLKIWTQESTVFQTNGRVIYSQPNIGAGVEFLHVEPQYLAMLEHWLEEAATGSSSSTT
jgi:PilZ domain